MKNNEFEKLILNFTQNGFDIQDNQIMDISSNQFISPEMLSNQIIEIFDVAKKLSDFIVFNWLYENDFEDIITDWYKTPLNFIINGNTNLFSGDYYYTSPTNIIVGCDPAYTGTNDTTIVTIQDSDGLIRYFNT